MRWEQKKTSLESNCELDVEKNNDTRFGGRKGEGEDRGQKCDVHFDTLLGSMTDTAEVVL